MKNQTRVLPMIALFAGLHAFAAPLEPVPVIVELFTSEGCSSCPPADAVLTRLESSEIPGVEVIALGEHVTYWDRLGWKDRFSQTKFTERQERFGRRFHLDSVYTPQVVVNGQAEVLGSDEGRIRAKILEAAHQPRIKLEISQGPDGVHWHAGNWPDGVRNASLMLAVTETKLDTNVQRGENSGRMLRHTGVVRNFTNLGEATRENSAGTVPVYADPAWQRENLKYVFFLQDPASMRIFGAAAAKP